MWEYHKTRMSSALFVPLALYLAIASSAGQLHTQYSDWIGLIFLAYCLIYQFRIWDDLASIDHDRKIHPDRVICQAKSLLPFYVLAAMFWLLNLLLLGWRSGDWSKPYIFLMLSGLIISWYRWRSSVSNNILVGAQIVLLKYPAIVWLISAPVRDQLKLQLLGVSMVAVYLVFATHEILHDDECQHAKGADAALALQITALCIVWVIMALLTPSEIHALRVFQWITVLTGLTVATVLFLIYIKRQMPTNRGYALFLIGGIVAFNLVLAR